MAENTFLFPYVQLKKHKNDWNNELEMQHFGLKAAVSLLALVVLLGSCSFNELQKPSQKSRTNPPRMSSEAISTRKKVIIDVLLRE